MGLFGGLGKSLFGGSSYTQPKWMRDAGQTSYDEYAALGDSYYGDGALNRNTAMYGQDWDAAAPEGQAGAYRGLSGAGYRPSGANYMGLARQRSMAGFRGQERGRLQQGRMGALQGRMGMLTGMQGLYQKQQKPGLLQRMGGMAMQAGQAYGASQGVPMGNDMPQDGGFGGYQYGSAQGPYGPATATPSTANYQPYQYDDYQYNYKQPRY
jgi:hypothetical protein